MDLSSLIKKFETNSDGQTKVANDVAAPAPVTTPAQPTDAVDSILKIAADLSGAEKQAELAHAKLAGQIMMDDGEVKNGSEQPY
jgi:phosphate-selective porin